MLPEVIHAAHKLQERGISARVASFHTVKPLDTQYLAEIFGSYKLVATIEEHSLIGGFGAAVAEWLIDSGVKSRRFVRFGTPDTFFKESGEQEYARHQLGLTGDQIADQIVQTLR